MSTKNDDGGGEGGDARALFAAIAAGEAGGLLGSLARRGGRRGPALALAAAELEALDPAQPSAARGAGPGPWSGLSDVALDDVALDAAAFDDGALAAEDRRSGARLGPGLRVAVEPTERGWRAEVLEAPEGWSLWWADRPLPLEVGARLHLEGDHPWLVLGPEGEELLLQPG